MHGLLAAAIFLSVAFGIRLTQISQMLSLI